MYKKVHILVIAAGRCTAVTRQPLRETTVLGLEAPLGQWLVGWWSWLRECAKRRVVAFSLGPACELAPGEKAGACAPQSSRALATAAHWLGPGLEAAANLSPIPASAT